MASVTNSMLSLSSLLVMMRTVIIITRSFQQGVSDGLRDRVAQVSLKHPPFASGVDFKKDMLTFRRPDHVNRPINQSELIHQRPEVGRHVVREPRRFPLTFTGRGQPPIALTFDRAACVDCAGKQMPIDKDYAKFN